MYTKSEKQLRLKHRELLQVPSFFSLCCYLTTPNINLRNHLKKIRGIDTSFMSDNNMITADEKRRILIVDDDPDIANLYKLSLEHDGFVVDAFNDPLLALSNYKVGIYDLLLIDIKMPQMNGFELYEKFRNMGDKPKVCFITAFEEFNKDLELFPNLKEKGCFLRKPIELSSLTRVVKSELGYN
jgi:CheY-like chemotaxis protein